MKSFSTKLTPVFVTATLIAAVSVSLRHVRAQPPPNPQAAPAARDPLAAWQYPGAKAWEESNAERLPAIPLHGIHFKTQDTLETVYLFYRKKAEPRFVANEGSRWRPSSQPAMLMTQFGNQAQSASFFYAPRKDADSALLIVHQPHRSLTIQISRDPQDKASTDILLIADEH